MLEVGSEEIGEGWRLVIFGIEGEVLAVLEASAGGDDGEVTVVMAGGVAEVGAAEDRGLIEEGVVAFLDLVEA